MKTVVDYILYSENTALINKNNIEAEYKINEYILFDDNYIDIKNKKYKRITKEYELLIDFKTSMCSLKYDDLDQMEFKIESELAITDNKIVLKYNFSEEEKKIIIIMKEVK